MSTIANASSRGSMTPRRGWWAPLLGAAIAVLGSCGTGPSGNSQQTPLPASPGPGSTSLSVAAKCLGPFHPGEYAGLACVVFVQDAANNPTNGVYADRSIFGGAAQSGVVKCPACGGPPWTFDLDLRIPPNMTPGVKTFAVWATYADGSRTETTASIEIAVPPS